MLDRVSPLPLSSLTACQLLHYFWTPSSLKKSQVLGRLEFSVRSLLAGGFWSKKNNNMFLYVFKSKTKKIQTLRSGIALQFIVVVIICCALGRELQLEGNTD